MVVIRWKQLVIATTWIQFERDTSRYRRNLEKGRRSKRWTKLEMSTTPRVVPHCRPCLACGSVNKTNRPMSYHLRKGVRKHLSMGIGYRTPAGLTAVLPPLIEIEENECMCLSCANRLDVILSSIDKLPLTNGKSLAVTGGITRPRRKRPTRPPPQPPPQLAPVVVTTIPHSRHAPPKKFPLDCCVVCHLAHQTLTSDVPPHTLESLREEITKRVGAHLGTLESTVRIFRATRVELADDGICKFDSKIFASILLHSTHNERVCKTHFDELIRAADVKAAGALPCAICGDKPTLHGDDEVRLLTCLANYCTPSMAATVIELKQVPFEQRESFCSTFRRFLENEFACGTCFTKLDLVRQQTHPVSS